MNLNQPLPPEVSGVYALLTLLVDPESFRAKLDEYAKARLQFEVDLKAHSAAFVKADTDRARAEELYKIAETYKVETERKAAQLEVDRKAFEDEKKKVEARLKEESQANSNRDADLSGREKRAVEAAQTIAKREKEVSLRDKEVSEREADVARAEGLVKEKMNRLKELAA